MFRLLNLFVSTIFGIYIVGCSTPQLIQKTTAPQKITNPQQSTQVQNISTNGNSSEFMDTSKALSKSITSLQHNPGVSDVGIASDPTKNIFNIAIAVSNGFLTSSQLNDIINNYLTTAQLSGILKRTQTGTQFLQPYNLLIEVHENSLGGKLLFFGKKQNGEDSIVWTKY